MIVFMFIKFVLFLLTLFIGCVIVVKIYNGFKNPKTDKKLDKGLEEKKDKLENMEAKNRTLTEEIEVTEQLNEANKEFVSNRKKVNNLNEEI